MPGTCRHLHRYEPKESSGGDESRWLRVRTSNASIAATRIDWSHELLRADDARNHFLVAKRRSATFASWAKRVEPFVSARVSIGGGRGSPVVAPG
jgi:hypothetical protein